MAVRRLADAAEAGGARRRELPGVARARRPAGGPVRAGAAARRETPKRSGEGECSATAPSPGPPARPRSGTPRWRSARRERFARRGAEVFARNCAGCHGRDGLGDGPAAAALTPAPRNLATALFSDRSLSESLWNGVRGSSMPSWNDLPSGELRGLVAYLKTIAPTEPPPDLTDARAGDGEGHLRQTVCGLPWPDRGRRRSFGGDPGPGPDQLPRGPAHGRTTPRRR